MTASTENKLTSNLGISTSSPLYSTGSAMENTCAALEYKKNSQGLTAGEEALLANCVNLISEGNASAVTNGIQQISPIALKSQQTTVRQTGTFNLGSIASRLLALRESGNQSQQDMAQRRNSVSGRPAAALVSNSAQTPQQDTVVTVHTGDESGGAAGDMEEESHWGTFVNASGSTGKRDPSEMTDGFDYDGFNLTAGGDYLFDNGLILGGAIGFGSTSSDLNNNAGSLDSDIVMFSLYGQYDFDLFYLDGVVGAGRGSYQNDRYQHFTTNGVELEQTLNGDTDGSLFFASLGGGKVVSVKDFALDFNGRLNYLRATIDGYTETTNNSLGTGLALELDDQTMTSITSEIGLRASYPFSLSFGVMQPEVSFSWLHEFKTGSEEIRARFANDPFSEGFVQTTVDNGDSISTIFTVPTEKRDADYANLGFGLNFLLPYGQSIMLNASTLLFYEDYMHWYYMVGYRKDF